ncbi:alkaline phosphatase-like protein [Clohesyomyces aquaticus]|uniref:alkaline phosphatase n=1 Tax=Clohesyomyces aquaticus TaxID=1231657 RepID=A0A1Y1Z4S0_9PLEO|nr:alkaline phosphatase-like protein [Clohesyomyces aquaticus]
MRISKSLAVGVAIVVGVSHAQTFQRLGTCPTLGCVFPPDQTDFLAGQYFDIRLEVHAPINGSEANGKQPDEKFTFTIAKEKGKAEPATTYFSIAEPKLERWNFSWYEDLFAKEAGKPSIVNVTSKAYRRVALYEPGEYTATLTYNNGSTTKASWLVRDLQEVRKAKNIIMFIGDGMTTNMITAARLIAHKAINGRYQTKMQMDQFPILGHQMTHSIDSFITDSANSATALYTGHKSTVNCLGVYADSSKDPFDDPKVETIAEMFHRLTGGLVGIVSTAFIADATPAALTAHTRDRGQYGAVVDSFLHGITNYTWTNWTGPDVLFGGGAEQFYDPKLGGKTYLNKDYYSEFSKAGYQVLWNKTSLAKASNDSRALGIFTVSNMAKWLDRNVYKSNLNQSLSPSGDKTAALDQPGLKDMTLKAIDILAKRSGDKGFFLMSEAASIDKMMHVLDYDRALGELLELDDTIKATIAKLKSLNKFKETLIIVTADHGHGFDVMGSVDTKYLAAQNVDRKKRDAVGTYQNSGLSQYANTGNLTYSEGVHFPSNWDPRYTLFQGLMADPDRRENWSVHKDGPRVPAVNITPSADFYANPKDGAGGILLNGTLPVGDDQGVHSLTDVPVFAMGPCQELFGGVYNSIDIFFSMAECFGLARGKGHGQ